MAATWATRATSKRPTASARTTPCPWRAAGGAAAGTCKWPTGLFTRFRQTITSFSSHSTHAECPTRRRARRGIGHHGERHGAACVVRAAVIRDARCGTGNGLLAVHVASHPARKHAYARLVSPTATVSALPRQCRSQRRARPVPQCHWLLYRQRYPAASSARAHCQWVGTAVFSTSPHTSGCLGCVTSVCDGGSS